MEDEVEYLMFPIVNEQGFRVHSMDNYLHMIRTIIDAQIELQEDYPDNRIIVVYEVGDGNAT